MGSYECGHNGEYSVFCVLPFLLSVFFRAWNTGASRGVAMSLVFVKVVLTLSVSFNGDISTTLLLNAGGISVVGSNKFGDLLLTFASTPPLVAFVSTS